MKIIIIYKNIRAYLMKSWTFGLDLPVLPPAGVQRLNLGRDDPSTFRLLQPRKQKKSIFV